MTPEIPADAERWQVLLSYPDYRRWWVENVTRQAPAKPNDDEAD